MQNAKVAPDWSAMLTEALTEPGLLSRAFSLFHNFSFLNSTWMLVQMTERDIELGPVASFMHWKALGRSVKKGEKALYAYMPRTVRGAKSKSDANPAAQQTVLDDEKPDDAAQHVARVLFMAAPRWFALSQTEAIPGFDAPVQPAEQAVGFDVEQAFQALGLQLVPFEDTNGNLQGYCSPNGSTVAINPIAEDRLETMFHEVAHCLLHKTEGQDAGIIADGAELDRSSKEVEAACVSYLVCAALGKADSLTRIRGYVQVWRRENPGDFEKQHAQRVFYAASKILKAGDTREPTQAPQRAKAA